MAAMLVRPRNTEKTSAVLEEVEGSGKAATQPDTSASLPAGHGRNGAEAFSGAQKVEIAHQNLKHGDRCPECREGNVYGQKEPKVLVRIVGQAPLAATVYSLERLRCGACGQVFWLIPESFIAGTVWISSANCRKPASIWSTSIRHSIPIATMKFSGVRPKRRLEPKHLAVLYLQLAHGLVSQAVNFMPHRCVFVRLWSAHFSLSTSSLWKSRPSARKPVLLAPEQSHGRSSGPGKQGSSGGSSYRFGGFAEIAPHVASRNLHRC